MLNIYIDKDTPAEELDLLGNLLLDLAHSRMIEVTQPEVTQAPKKTKAKPVKLTSIEPEGALPEALTNAKAAEVHNTEPLPEEVPAKKLEPVQEPEPAPVEETSKPLDLVAMRAELAPIMKDKKDELVALIKEYGDSLPKIDPAQYPEILEKAKAL